MQLLIKLGIKLLITWGGGGGGLSVNLHYLKIQLLNYTILAACLPIHTDCTDKIFTISNVVTHACLI